MWQRFSNFLFGPRIDSELPERVRQAIKGQQNESEKLITWVQLALVMIFATLYAIAPSTARDAEFQPVPWALGLYFLFTVLRMAFAYRNYLPGAFLVASAIADMLLLMFLIWSFHIQYEQPASFYLKAPTMIYVFIFIALRALRFEPKYILVTGAAAVIGWTALVYYVVVAVPEDPMITRDYVAYLTSNSVLIGAEVDKILSISIVTGVLAVAVLRAQRAFHTAVLESTAAKDLSRFVSREVADHITSADQQIQPGDGESRVATVMFTDIEGFSTVSEKLTPQELANMLNDYFTAMSEVIDRFGGVITQFEGDAMLITYNAVTPDDDHVDNAIRTAMGIQKAGTGRTFGSGAGSELKTRCGISTGEIIIGAIGSHDRLTFTVHGDDVNIAARLEQLNKEYGTYIMLTDVSAEACGPEFEPRHVCEVTVRGRATPTQVFTV